MVNNLQSEAHAFPVKCFEGSNGDQHVLIPLKNTVERERRLFKRTVIDWDHDALWICNVFINSSARHHSIVKAFFWRVVRSQSGSLV